MVSEEFISLLMQVRSRLNTVIWLELINSISAWGEEYSLADITQALPGLTNPDAAWLLNRALSSRGNLSWSQVAVILSTIDVLYKSQHTDVEVVWSGPTNGVFPVRRFDQVLYDEIESARQRILLVTFAANKINLLAQKLLSSIDRGVSISLILESEAESGGQLTHDAINAFRPLKSKNCNVYFWPIQNREKNPLGRPGKLHAKCAVVDSVAIVGSANLTDDAFNRNIEIGLLIKEETITDLVYAHFLKLIEKRVFEKMVF